MPTAIVASVRAIAQAHTTFSRAAFSTVLFAYGRVEGRGGDRQSDETKQRGQRGSRERHFLPPFAARCLEHDRRQCSVIAASKGILLSIMYLTR
jgi:hypothetical protein